MSKIPIAVLISDVHYSLNTLVLADQAMRTAIAKAKELNVPLIDAGDLTNDKAILRAEVMNQLISTMKTVQGISVYLLVGNHSLVNEKGTDHALGFLKPYARIVETLSMIPDTNLYLMPYQNDSTKVKEYLELVPENAILIMHQGVRGAWMGDYIQDKSSVDPSIFGSRTVLSGHYHKHQSIGPVTYIGNPYTLSFGEANDGPKGYLILYSDGSYSREILDLRRHIIIQQHIVDLNGVKVNKDDLVRVKILGKKFDLADMSKSAIAEVLFGNEQNFKLDYIYEDVHTDAVEPFTSPESAIDQMIDLESLTEEHKNHLKQLWRGLL